MVKDVAVGVKEQYMERHTGHIPNVLCLQNESKWYNSHKEQ